MRKMLLWVVLCVMLAGCELSPEMQHRLLTMPPPPGPDPAMQTRMFLLEQQQQDLQFQQDMDNIKNRHNYRY